MEMGNGSKRENRILEILSKSALAQTLAGYFLVALLSHLLFALVLGSAPQLNAYLALNLIVPLALCFPLKAAASRWARRSEGRAAAARKIVFAVCILVLADLAVKAAALRWTAQAIPIFGDWIALHASVRSGSGPVDSLGWLWFHRTLFLLCGLLFCAFTYRFSCFIGKNKRLMAAATAMWAAIFPSVYLGWLFHGGFVDYVAIKNFAAIGGMSEALFAIGGFIFAQAFFTGESSSEEKFLGAYFASEAAKAKAFFG